MKKEKRKYYNNLDLNIFDDYKKFWQRIKPLFSDKQKALQNDIILAENNKNISDKEEIAERTNPLLIETIDNLEPYAPDNVINISSENMDATSSKTFQDIIKKYDSHPSIIKINENVRKENIFSFTDMTSLDFENEIIKLDKKKASMDDDIPTKVLIGTKDIISNYLSTSYNDSKNDQKYPMSLKRANVIPVHKKDERTLMTNYRPVSLLPIVSKIFERNMYNQILTYIDKFLSPYLFGFRKGHSTETCLINMLEAWKKAIDEEKCAGGILTDLSKAFDFLNQNLLNVKCIWLQSKMH